MAKIVDTHIVYIRFKQSPLFAKCEGTRSHFDGMTLPQDPQNDTNAQAELREIINSGKISQLPTKIVGIVVTVRQEHEFWTVFYTPENTAYKWFKAIGHHNKWPTSLDSKPENINFREAKRLMLAGANIVQV